MSGADDLATVSSDEMSALVSRLLAEPVDTGRPETAALLHAVTERIAEWVEQVVQVEHGDGDSR